MYSHIIHLKLLVTILSQVRNWGSCDGLGRLSLFMSWVGRFDSRGTAVPLTEFVILLCVWEQQQAAVSPAWLCVFCLLLPPP